MISATKKSDHGKKKVKGRQSKKKRSRSSRDSGNHEGEGGEEEDRKKRPDEKQDEEEIDANNLLAALRFGWNSVFSVSGSSGAGGGGGGGTADDDDEDIMNELTDEDIDAIIDRSRGMAAAATAGSEAASSGPTTASDAIDVLATGNSIVATSASTSASVSGGRASTSTLDSASTAPSTGEDGDTTEQAEPVLTAEEKKAEEARRMKRIRKLLENQEQSAVDFNENVPLVSVRGQAATRVGAEASSTTILAGSEGAGGDIVEAIAASSFHEIAAAYRAEEYVAQQAGSGTVGRSKRNRVSRTVQMHVVGVGIVDVLKKNNYSLDAGEPSVFESEYANKSFRKSTQQDNPFVFVPQAGRQVAGRDFDSQDECQVRSDPSGRSLV